MSFASTRVGEIEVQAALIPIEGFEKEIVRSLLKGRYVAANFAAGTRFLNLYNLGTQIGEVD